MVGNDKSSWKNVLYNSNIIFATKTHKSQKTEVEIDILVANVNDMLTPWQ